MERLRFFIFTLLLSLSFTTVDAKYVEIVHDKKTLEAYTANATYVNITEDYHNRLIDRTRKKKEKIAEYHATMESIKELYRFSMQNIRGFGYESKRLGITVFQPRLKVCTFARTNYYEYGKQRQVQESP